MKKKLIKKSERVASSTTVSPKGEIIVVYENETPLINEPHPDDVNLAYTLLEEMWKNEKSQKFVRHLCIAFNEFNTNTFDSAFTFGEILVAKDCITGFDCIGLSDFSNMFINYNPLHYKAKIMLGTFTEEDEKEVKELQKTMPDTIRYRRIGYIKPELTTKIISSATFKALCIFQEKHYEELNRDLSYSHQAQINKMLGIKQETNKERWERLKRNKQTIPDVGINSMSNILNNDTLDKLNLLKEKLK